MDQSITARKTPLVEPFHQESQPRYVDLHRKAQDLMANNRKERILQLEDQTKLAVAAVMLKLGETMITISPADVRALQGLRVITTETSDGVVVKIS